MHIIRSMELWKLGLFKNQYCLEEEMWFVFFTKHCVRESRRFLDFFLDSAVFVSIPWIAKHLLKEMDEKGEL